MAGKQLRFRLNGEEMLGETEGGSKHTLCLIGPGGTRSGEGEK